jgi:hypothetical protein
MKRAAIICFSDYTKEPRVLRTIGALMQDFKIDVYSSSKNGSLQVCDVSEYDIDYFNPQASNIIKKIFQSLNDKVKGIFFLNEKYFERQYWKGGRDKLLAKVNAQNYDLVIGHGIYTLPIVAMTGAHTQKIFNAHEHYLKEFDEDLTWKKYTEPFYRFILDRYLRKVDTMHCVTEEIFKSYQQAYGINGIIVTNATDYYDLSVSPINDKIKIIHHGAAIRARQLELMADVMKILGDAYELTFMLTTVDKSYLEELKSKYSAVSNINFTEPVAISKIAEYCNQFDIGMYILPPVNFNSLNALPNKLFEFIQARLCIAVSPNPEIRRLIEKYQLGIVSENYTAEAMAKVIKNLSPEDIMKYKQNSHNTAKLVNADVTKKNIIDHIYSLISRQ